MTPIKAAVAAFADLTDDIVSAAHIEAACKAYLAGMAEDEETVERLARAIDFKYSSIKATCTEEQDVDPRAVARAALLALAKGK